MPRCNNTLCTNEFDPDDMDSCAFCSKNLGCCPECLEAHELVCADSTKLENDYSNDPRNER